MSARSDVNSHILLTRPRAGRKDHAMTRAQIAVLNRAGARPAAGLVGAVALLWATPASAAARAPPPPPPVPAPRPAAPAGRPAPRPRRAVAANPVAIAGALSAVRIATAAALRGDGSAGDQARISAAGTAGAPGNAARGSASD